MSAGVWSTAIVVLIAFVAGYSIVSFLVNRFRSQPRASEGPAERGRQADYRRWQEEQDRQTGGTWEAQSEEQRYAESLGLGGKFTIDEIKSAYRDLLTQYHPDKVNHLGDELKSMAEAKTLEIRGAYEFFRNKYNIR